MKRKPTHPGRIFREEVIEPLGVTITDAAENLGVSRKALSEFVNEKASLSPDMAVRISMATGSSADVWLKLQLKLDLWYAEQKKFKVKKLERVG